MPTLQLERRKTEAIVLALVSITAVGSLRFYFESQTLFIAEMIVIATLFVAAVVTTSGHKTSGEGYFRIAIPMTPVLFAFIARVAGSPIAFEMTALTTLGAGSLTMALGKTRTRAMSLVASGFLTLFAVAISDSSYSVLLAIAWMAVCVWHLVANHWERLELCAAHQVRRGSGVRPVSVFVAITVCMATGLVVRGRVGESQRFELGVMPTSGGSQWSDPAARSGVGTGDAAIAAKDHAESFGAVESELFLESTESTLFDMFSDSIGEPKKKNKWERRQGLAADRVPEAHQKTARSDKGGSSFSTDRTPPKKHLHFNDAAESAVIQWAGPTGIRLAMNRYDAFDGVEWTNTAEHLNETLSRREHNGAAWYCDPAIAISQECTPEVNLLKVLRLDSTRLPVPMLTSALHIKDVDRPDFFAIATDGSFFMPGRDKVPPLTVVNVASIKVMEDELWEGLTIHPAPESIERTAARTSVEHKRAVPDARAFGSSAHERRGPNPSILVEDLARQWTVDLNHPYEKLQAIVSHLRSEFGFDRSVESATVDSVAEFLRTQRGGDHLFATVATLMAREIGLQSRLVTGFYVRPSAIDAAARHVNISPQDVHVWAEVQLDDGRWFEIEPTPGYREPDYRPSAWLVAKQLAAAKWPHATGMIVLAGWLFFTRLIWIELGLSLLYQLGSIVLPHRRTALVMGVLQTRAKFAGCPRNIGRPQRDWLLEITAMNAPLHETATRFCDAADRAAFAGTGNTRQDHNFSKELLMNLKIRFLRQLATGTSA